MREAKRNKYLPWLITILLVFVFFSYKKHAVEKKPEVSFTHTKKKERKNKNLNLNKKNKYIEVIKDRLPASESLVSQGEKPEEFSSYCNILFNHISRFLSDDSLKEEFYYDKKRFLDPVVGGWYYKKTYKSENKLTVKNEHSTSGKFFSSLAKADLIVGLHGEVDIDLEEALSLMHEVAIEDPSNAVVWIYLAEIEKMLGVTENIESYYNEAEKGTVFSTYTQDLTKALMDNIKSPRDFFIAQEILAEMPIPNYDPISNIVNVSKSNELAEIMMKDGLDHNNIRESVDYNYLDYAFGYRMAIKLGISDNYPSLKGLRSEKYSLSRSTKFDYGMLNKFQACVNRLVLPL